MATKKTAAPKAVKKTMAKVINGNLNVRKEASLDAEIVRILNDGSKIEIVEKNDDWCKIKDGYVMSQFLSF